MRSTRTRTLVGAVLLGGLLLSACSGDTAIFDLTSATEAQELLTEQPAGLTILDVRTPQEYADGHLSGAANLDFYEPDFAASLDELDKEQPYFVYCRSGSRSESAIETMKGLGFTEVYELDGGIVSWVQAGLPVEG